MTKIKTVPEAEMAGMIAGMDTRIKREDIPEDFAQIPALREAWLEAFDKMRQSLRGTPVEAPKGAKEPTEPRKPRKTKAAPQEAPEPVPTVAQKPKRMDDICLELHHEAKEYA